MIKDLDIIKVALESLGYKLVKSEPGSMDSGIVAFSNEEKQIEITKDRSQWMLAGPKDELEPIGLWRAFDDTHEFKDALVRYIKA
ncbi:MAG: hypothetical protein WBO34_05620 [Gammaproteobacteria bacterium]